MEKDSLCMNCSAACCRSGVVMALNSSESEYFLNSGVSFELHNSSIKRGIIGRVKDKIFNREVKINYILTEDCKFIEYDWTVGALICSIYKSENRPNICDSFKAGEYGCMSIRANSGIDSAEVFVEWKNNTQT